MKSVTVVCSYELKTINGHSAFELSKTSRFEVFTAVTMMTAVLWDVKAQFVLHRKHIMSPLQSPAGWCFVRFGLFTALIMKNAIFCDVTPRGSCKKQRFGGMY
jgi:hypothetical protein